MAHGHLFQLAIAIFMPLSGMERPAKVDKSMQKLLCHWLEL